MQEEDISPPWLLLKSHCSRYRERGSATPSSRQRPDLKSSNTPPARWPAEGGRYGASRLGAPMRLFFKILPIGLEKDGLHHRDLALSLTSRLPSPRKSSRRQDLSGMKPFATWDQTPKQNLKLLLAKSTEEVRPPLPQHLRPARPPEREGRGAGEQRPTLKATRGEEGEGGEKRAAQI